MCKCLGHGPFSHLFEGIKKRILDKSKPQTEEVTPPDDPQQKSKKMVIGCINIQLFWLSR